MTNVLPTGLFSPAVIGPLYESSSTLRKFGSTHSTCSFDPPLRSCIVCCFAAAGFCPGCVCVVVELCASPLSVPVDVCVAVCADCVCEASLDCARTTGVNAT